MLAPVLLVVITVTVLRTKYCNTKQRRPPLYLYYFTAVQYYCLLAAAASIFFYVLFSRASCLVPPACCCAEERAARERRRAPAAVVRSTQERVECGAVGNTSSRHDNICWAVAVYNCWCICYCCALYYVLLAVATYCSTTSPVLRQQLL